MWIILVYGIGFLFGALGNTFGAVKDPANAVVGYALSLFLFDTWRFLKRARAERQEFGAWLLENREAIEAGRATYRGLSITGPTEVREYAVAISLVITIKPTSGTFFPGHRPGYLAAIRLTTCSLLIGWFGLLGPWHTIGAVVTNLRGGRRRQIADLLDDFSGHQRRVVHLTESAMMNARRIMAERNFPEGTALQVQATEKHGVRSFEVSYDDLPPSDGSLWRDESQGLLVVVSKKDFEKAEGLFIDFADGEYTFKENGKHSNLIDEEL